LGRQFQQILISNANTQQLRALATRSCCVSFIYESNTMATFLKIAFAVLVGILFNVFIFIKANLPNFEDNGFVRSFLPRSVSITEPFDVPSRSVAIAGQFGGKLYLTTDDPAKLVAVDMQSRQAKLVNIQRLANWLAAEKVPVGHTAVIDSPYYYVFAFNAPGIYVYNLARSQTDATYTTDAVFTSGVPLSATRFVLRQYSTDEKAFRLSRISHHGETRWEQGLSLPSSDMGLSSDGRLMQDDQTGLLVYEHYYNNRILVADTALNAVHSFSLLDTVAPKLRLKPTAPRIMTNSAACLHRGLLYLCSNLRADNEPYNEYIKHIPVDIFDIQTAGYRGSFYLPALDGKLIKSMDIVDNRLIALYFNDQIASFTIPALQ